MGFEFFAAGGEKSKESDDRAHVTNQNLDKKPIPTGSFIIFSHQERVEKVGDKPKGELSGETLKVGAMSSRNLS